MTRIPQRQNPGRGFAGAGKGLLALAMIFGVVFFAAPGFAQDSDGERVKVLEPDGQGSKPAVIERDKPEGAESTNEGEEEQVAGQAQDEADLIDFGETVDIDNNFEDGFDVSVTPSSTRFHIDFRDADLADVVKLMSAQTGRNFIIADSLKTGKKITIISPNPVSKSEAYRAFLSALHMNGLTVVKSGSFYKIVDTNTGIKEPIDPIMSDGSVPANDALVTHIIELEHVDLSQVKPVLDALKSPSGQIIEYAPSNTLIITDTGKSVRRLRKIIDELDSDGADGEKIWVYQVQYADANEISSLVGQIFQPTGKNQAQATTANGEQFVLSQIVADERTNKLIIVSNERSYERIKKLILKLDVELPDSGRINVVHLQNSDSTEMAQVLSELSNQLQSNDPRRTPTKTQAQNQATAANAALLQGEVSVVANEATNDLIIVASPRDFLAMKQVIKELDRPRKQVFVEAVILEVSLDRTRDLGIVLHGGNVFDTSEGDAYLLGRTELNSMQSLSAAPLFLGAGSTPGLLAALIGPTLDLGALEVPAFSLLMNALQTNTDVNVLSTPTILTLDNEEAEISVGERIPFPTSSGGLGYNSALLSSATGVDANLASTASSLLGGGLGTQFQRVDVALTLRIKPQINEAGDVRLEIEEEIEEVKPGGSDLGGPTTRRRQLKTVVIAGDQQTVVLGGLIRDSENESVSKVPILGDIPVIGYLFRSTNKQMQKQNLLLLLTPYIIEDESDLDKVRIRKMEEREAFLEYFGRKDLDYVRSVNFDKKHGLLEEIRQKIDAADAELADIQSARGMLDLRAPDDGIDLPEGLNDGYGSGQKTAPKKGTKNNVKRQQPKRTQKVQNGPGKR